MSEYDAVKAIQKFAFCEGRTLLKEHATTIFNWSHNTALHSMPDKVREALLETLARMYQIVEGMPHSDEGPPKPH